MDKLKSLKVAEVFSSIQGEGPQMGHRAVFVRLTACNLNCVWCDTTEVWRQGERMEYKDILKSSQMLDIATGAHLVITGGEPLLQQSNIPGFIQYIRSTMHIKIFVEIETNGTITPDEALWKEVDQWNCSPKTLNSGEKEDKFYNPKAIATLSKGNTAFKFVVEKAKDLDEIKKLYGTIRNRQVWLMPCADNRKQLALREQMVIWLAMKNGYNYSNRLHIQVWDKTTGV